VSSHFNLQYESTLLSLWIVGFYYIAVCECLCTECLVVVLYKKDFTVLDT